MFTIPEVIEALKIIGIIFGSYFALLIPLIVWWTKTGRIK